jgi:hypothetical protein
MSAREQAMLIEEAATAWRPRAADRTLEHPAWADLDPGARNAAFNEALVMRVLEAAIDPDGYSTTVRAVERAIGKR